MTTVYSAERPNILWIVSEDNGSYLGCYGDKTAETPNLDKLAAEGIRYTNCFANAPVCAIARSSWIFGAPAVTMGTHHMRSRYRVPQSFVPYPTLLKQQGYYVTNGARTDYNTSSLSPKIWDESNNNANYKKRAPGQPFFSIVNIFNTHESQIFVKENSKKPAKLNTPKEHIVIPPYQVNVPEVMQDWQRVYGRVKSMDQIVGRLIRELEKSGEADNTIIFYCSDHGGITLRSKRFLHDTGTRVPFIVYVPEKWKHLAPEGHGPGTVSERLTQFIDMPATFLALAGAKVPKQMTGKVIMGDQSQMPDKTVFLFSGRFDESPDMSRAVTDGRWKYIRNYEPDRPRFQMLNYPLRQAGQRAQWRAYKAGKTNALQSAQYLPQPPEELYDTQSDPHEVVNLVKDSVFLERLKQMRAALDRHMIESHDTGFIPEPLMAKINADIKTSIYAFAQSEANYPLERILPFANLAGLQNAENLQILSSHLTDKNEIMRYWAALGLRALGKEAKSAEDALKKALSDPSPSVRINAAIALANIGPQPQKQMAVKFLLKI